MTSPADQSLSEGFSDLDKEKLIAAAERLIRNWKSAELSGIRSCVSEEGYVRGIERADSWEHKDTDRKASREEPSE